MTVKALDHVNIRSRDPEATVAFFRDIMGMERSAPPGMKEGKGAWMLDGGGHPVVHIGALDTRYPTDGWRPVSSASDSGALHHVAFNCDEYDAMIARLEGRDFAFETNHVDSIDLRQIFVTEGNGILIEMNFRRNERIGRIGGR